MKTTKALAFALASLAAPALLLAAEKKPLPKDLPPFGADKPLPVPTIAQSKLPNGLTVWLVKRSGFPRAAVVLAVRGAGTAADPKDAEGLTELLATRSRRGPPPAPAGRSPRSSRPWAPRSTPTAPPTRST